MSWIPWAWGASNIVRRVLDWNRQQMLEQKAVNTRVAAMRLPTLEEEIRECRKVRETIAFDDLVKEGEKLERREANRGIWLVIRLFCLAMFVMFIVSIYLLLTGGTWACLLHLCHYLPQT